MKLHVTCLILAVGAVGLAACGSSDAGTESEGSANPKITIGMPGALPVYAPLYTAEALGYFEDEGVDVEIITLSGLANCVPPMVAGSVDACTSEPVSISQAADANIKIIATMSNPTVNALNVSKDVHDWSDLQGAKIAASSNAGNTASNISIQALLADHGLLLSEGDYILQNVGISPARFAALQAGQSDAAITSAPQSYQAAREGYPILGTSAENGTTIGNYLITVPGTTDEEGVSRLVAAVRRASAWISDPANKDEVIERFQDIFSMEAEDSASFYDEWVEKLGSFKEEAVSVSSITDQIALYDKFSDEKAPMTADELVEPKFAGD